MKTRIKQIILFILALTIAFSSSGCSQSTPEHEDDLNSEDTEKTEDSEGTENSDETGTIKEPVLLVEAIDAASQPKHLGDLMDFLFYAQSVIKFEKQEFADNGTALRRCFETEEKNFNVLENYVNLLCESYGYELVGDPYYGGDGLLFFDFVLRYTGNKIIPATVNGGESGNQGNVVLKGYFNKGKIKGEYSISPSLEESDDGYRINKSEIQKTVLGESLYAGLYRLGNGDYQTTDGRFTVSAGKAFLIEDGQQKLLNSRYEKDISSQRLRVFVENDYSYVMQNFYIPTSEDWEAGIYRAAKFIVDYDSSSGINGKLLPSYYWENMFTHFHDGNYVYPTRGLNGEITNLNIRLLCIDGSTAVFYSCSSYRTAPFTVEALIAVSLDVDARVDSGNNSSSDSSVTLTPSKKDKTCLNCKGTGYRDCLICDGKGFNLYYYNGPTYGSNINRYTYKECPGATCQNGKVKCSMCNGTGKR